MIKYILAYVISCSLFCYFSYDYAHTKGNKELVAYQLKITKESSDQIEALQTKLTKQQVDKENEIKTINHKYDTIVASLHNRTQRNIEIKDTSTGIISTGTGSTGQQLFREDAEFLVRQAQLADTLKESLTACSRYLLDINK